MNRQAERLRKIPSCFAVFDLRWVKQQETERWGQGERRFDDLLTHGTMANLLDSLLRTAGRCVCIVDLSARVPLGMLYLYAWTHIAFGLFSNSEMMLGRWSSLDFHGPESILSSNHICNASSCPLKGESTVGTFETEDKNLLTVHNGATFLLGGLFSFNPKKNG